MEDTKLKGDLAKAVAWMIGAVVASKLPELGKELEGKPMDEGLVLLRDRLGVGVGVDMPATELVYRVCVGTWRMCGDDADGAYGAASFENVKGGG